MGVRKNFTSRGKLDVLLILFRLLMMQCNWTFKKRMILPAPQRKCPTLRQQSQKLLFVSAAMLLFHSCFFSHSITLRALLLSAVTVLLHYLPKMSMFNSHIRQKAYYHNLKWTFEDLLPCYCYAMKINSRTIHSQVSQSASAGKGADMSEQQAHYFTAAVPKVRPAKGSNPPRELSQECLVLQQFRVDKLM